MCLHLCNWIDQQHPVQIDPYRSLIFCFSLFLIIFVKFHLLLHVFCFTEEDEDRWKTQRSLVFTFSFHLSQNSGFFLEFWLFSPEFDFVWNSKLLWIRTSFLEFWFFWGEFWLFSWNLTLCGIPHFCEFWLFSWTSDFLWIPTSFLEFWFFGGEFWLLPGTSDFFEILTFFLEFEHFFCYSDFFWILNFSRNFDFLGNSDFFWILNFWVNSDFFLLFWLFLNYNIFLDFWLFSWTVDFSLNF